MMPEPTVTTDRWLLSRTYRKPFTAWKSRASARSGFRVGAEKGPHVPLERAR